MKNCIVRIRKGRPISMQYNKYFKIWCIKFRNIFLNKWLKSRIYIPTKIDTPYVLFCNNINIRNRNTFKSKEPFHLSWVYTLCDSLYLYICRYEIAIRDIFVIQENCYQQHMANQLKTTFRINFFLVIHF